MAVQGKETAALLHLEITVVNQVIMGKVKANRATVAVLVKAKANKGPEAVLAQVQALVLVAVTVAYKAEKAQVVAIC